MIAYRYVKKTAVIKSVKKRAKTVNPKIIAVFLVIVGLFFLANAAYPIISYQLLISPRFSPSFVSSNPEAAIAQSFGTTETPGTQIDLLDLTRASNWFPEENVIFDESQTTFYTLSIPKLGITEAKVTLGDDLKKALVQYPGTAAPGRFGNTVIFGHSVLPQFFNPKNYVSIFSTLPTLRPKDEIYVNFNQVKYKYIVEQMIEVAPNDISILAQRYDDSYLTLITCVPPGTYMKRLIVRSRLTKI